MTGEAARIGRLARFGLNTADAERAATFYETAFGCRRIAKDRLPGADRVMLALAGQIVQLMQFDSPGAPYPSPSSSSDLVFQHFAIAVADMERARQRLSATPGWTPISTAGPERLPASSGGVTAFKFRDPEGHPLELLAVPPDRRADWPVLSPDAIFLGIDHSAISVADSAASIAFYQGLGLSVFGRSFNQGPEQERLDDVAGARVEVTALAPSGAGPHLELLCYREAQRRPTPALSVNDIASTQLIFEQRGASDAASGAGDARFMRDPDGHALLIVPSEA